MTSHADTMLIPGTDPTIQIEFLFPVLFQSFPRSSIINPRQKYPRLPWPPLPQHVQTATWPVQWVFPTAAVLPRSPRGTRGPGTDLPTWFKCHGMSCYIMDHDGRLAPRSSGENRYYRKYSMSFSFIFWVNMGPPETEMTPSIPCPPTSLHRWCIPRPSWKNGNHNLASGYPGVLDTSASGDWWYLILEKIGRAQGKEIQSV